MNIALVNGETMYSEALVKALTWRINSLEAENECLKKENNKYKQKPSAMVVSMKTLKEEV